MAGIAYLLLCHKAPDQVIAQIEALTAAGDSVAVHYDGRAATDEYARIRAAFQNHSGVRFAQRVRCGWGSWSLVEATLNLARTALEAFPDASHFYLISGDCVPVQPAHVIQDVLAEGRTDYIEAHPFETADWIKTGLREERLIYRHPFNERTQKQLFYGALWLQRALGLRRRPPHGLAVAIGSQWWCLRRGTLERVLTEISERPDIVRFFKTTWIPDEVFFQTLVRRVVPDREISNRPPTFLIFSDYGMPVAFHNDQFDLLVRQDTFFARKTAPGAAALRDRLWARFASDEPRGGSDARGHALYRFAAAQGRVGHRFGRAAWEAGSEIGPQRQLMVIVCKKWHVADRLRRHIAQATNLPTVGYVFDDMGTQMPDLGGIESNLAKRGRHRRAFLGLLFQHYQTDQLLICLDPNNTGHLADFFGDRADVRMLEVQCRYSDAWLSGHAERIGVSSGTDAVTGDVLRMLRTDITEESVRLRDARFPVHIKLSEEQSPAEGAAALASLLSIPEEKAREIAETPHLFAD